MKDSAYDAVFLGQVIQLITKRNAAYITNWVAIETRGFPGNLMCFKHCDVQYPDNGPRSKLGEDANVAQQLIQKRKITIMAEKPYLYIYQTHGANSWLDEHHQRLIQHLAISKGKVLRQKQQILKVLVGYGLKFDLIRFLGSNGEAFTFQSF
jgi:hypothetical protein